MEDFYVKKFRKIEKKNFRKIFHDFFFIFGFRFFLQQIFFRKYFSTFLLFRAGGRAQRAARRSPRTASIFKIELRDKKFYF